VRKSWRLQSKKKTNRIKKRLRSLTPVRLDLAETKSLSNNWTKPNGKGTISMDLCNWIRSDSPGLHFVWFVNQLEDSVPNLVVYRDSLAISSLKVLVNDLLSLVF
jgi:hypothetical protein